jgi:hypothetical protein
MWKGRMSGRRASSLIAFVMMLFMLLSLAACGILGGVIGKEQSSGSKADPSVSQKRFDHFEKDFVSIKDFIEDHRDDLYVEEPTAIYYEYDNDGFYLYTNDSLDTLRIDAQLQKSFENIYVLINANGGYDYINLYEDKISFELQGGTHNITYNQKDETPKLYKPSVAKWNSHKYADNWYYMSGVESGNEK